MGEGALLRDALDRYDLVLWIDADAVIVDPSQDIADGLAPDRQLGLRIAHCLGVPVDQRLRDMTAALEGRLR